MRLRSIGALILLLLSGAAVSAQQHSPRSEYRFDQGWSFRLCTSRQEVEALVKSPERGEFRPVQIPHDWSVELPFDREAGGSAGYLPGGLGLYVKEFTLPAAAADAEMASIVFDGVYHKATVWLNGRELGRHVYGYTDFSFDITRHLKKNGPNRLAVFVDMEQQSRWYTGAGIYRHVWLKTSGRQHVRHNGLWVKSSADGNVEVSTQVDGGRRYRLEHTLFGPDGALLARTGETSLKVENPQLWSPDSPVLYTLKTVVYDHSGKPSDEQITKFGFREARFEAATGFWLNGRNIKLKGVCLHQDAGSLGVAVPDEVWLRRLKALKAIGCNAVRCSHNPPSPEFLDLCDSLGLLVIDEAFDKWKAGYYSASFDEHARRDITDMVLRDRNHPSVIVWSIGNEVTEALLTSDEGVERARFLHDIVKALDPTRPTLVACQSKFADKFGDVTDLVGYNYMEPRMIEDHKRHPERKMLVTEAFPYYSGLRADNVRDFVELNPWNFVEDNPFIAGSFVWAGVDYLGESAPWPAKGWCASPFDITMKEKPQAAFYHPAWSPEKDYLKLMVRDNCFDQPAGKDHWQYPAMADTWDLPYVDERCVEVRCYTTCDSVRFYFPMWSNPQMPLKTRVTADYPDHCIRVQIPSARGKVLAVGFKGGREVLRDSLVNHGPVAGVELEADHTVLEPLTGDFSPRGETCTVSHIRFRLVDSLGRLQQMEPKRFSVEVEGPLRLLGEETGDLRREISWRTTEMNTYFGEGLIRVQSTPECGSARVLVHVEGFEKPFVKEIEIIPVRERGYVPVTNGGRIYYESRGEGTAVILLHGHTLDRRMWDPQLKDFCGRYRVITVDMRGYGRSSHQTEGVQFTHVDDVITVMDSLRVDRAHIVGLSMGGFVTGDMVGMYPDRMLSCVMCSGAMKSDYKSPQEPMEPQEMERKRASIAEVLAMGVDNWKAEWIDRLVLNGGSHAAGIRPAITEMVTDWDGFQLTHIESRLYYGREAFAGLKSRRPAVPTMYLSGETEHKGHMKMLDFLPDSRQVELPDCGHMSNMERPALFNKTVLDFLEYADSKR